MPIISDVRDSLEHGFNEVAGFLAALRDRSESPAAKRLWTPETGLPVSRLLELASEINKELGTDIFGGDDAYQALFSDLTPIEFGVSAASSNHNSFILYPNAFARYRLARHICDAAEILNLSADKNGRIRSLYLEIENIRSIARSRIYLGIGRRWESQRGGHIHYRYIITFFAHERKALKLSQLFPKEYLRMLDHAEQVDFRVLPPVSLAASSRKNHPQGPFSLPRPYLCPGLSVCSPSGSWSSINAIVHQEGTSDNLVLGSGHGMTDFYTAKSGDSIFRPLQRSGSSVVASLLPFEVPKYDSTYDIPSLSGDHALAVITHGVNGHNTIEHTPYGQISVRQAKPISTRGPGTNAIKLHKIGANTAYQEGMSQFDGQVVTAIDDLGNPLVLRDQIEIVKDGNAFSGPQDSGGLVFELKKGECVSVGLITSTNSNGGKNGLTFASPTYSILSSNGLSLVQDRS